MSLYCISSPPLALALPEVGFPAPSTNLALQAKFDLCLLISERITLWDIQLGLEIGGGMGSRGWDSSWMNVMEYQ